MHQRLTLAIAFVVLLFAAPPRYATAADQPNVVLIMADDLGYGDVGFTGNATVKTPALDEMARVGTRLNRFYTAPVCTPTRASVMTGRNAFRSGTYWAGKYPLPESEVTLGEIARQAGYRTGFFGKWHLGKLTADGREVFAGQKPAPKEFAPPWRQGFDVCFAAEFSVPTYNPGVWDFEWTSVPEGKDKLYVMDRTLARGQATTRDGKPMVPWANTFWREGGRPAGREIAGDSSALVTDEAVRFISASAAARKPFLAVIWLFTPHSPTAAGDDDRGRYPSLDVRRQHWYGSISAMDAQVGRVRAELARLGVADDTLLHFCSDNGPSWIHDLGSAGGFRGRKGDVYEGGVRVPAVVEWPAKLRGVREVNAPLSTDDLLPTIAALLGVETDPRRPLDGENVLPLLDGTSRGRARPVVVHSVLRQNPVGWQAGEARQSAVIDGDWKLVSVDDDKTFALFDLATDPAEQTDLAARQPARVEQMKAHLVERVARFKDSANGLDDRPAGR